MLELLAEGLGRRINNFKSNRICCDFIQFNWSKMIANALIAIYRRLNFWHLAKVFASLKKTESVEFTQFNS